MLKQVWSNLSYMKLKKKKKKGGRTQKQRHILHWKESNCHPLETK